MNDLTNIIDDFVNVISDAIVESVNSKLLAKKDDFDADFEESPKAKKETGKKPKKLGDKKAEKNKKAKKPKIVEESETLEEPEAVDDLDGCNEITSDDLLMLMHKVTNKSGLKIVIGIMKKFGANKQSELDSDDYPAVVDALKAEL